MSLVNDMLVDLDARKSGAEPEPQPGLTPARRESPRLWVKALLGVAAVVLVILSATAYRYLAERHSMPVDTAMATSVEAMDTSAESAMVVSSGEPATVALAQADPVEDPLAVPTQAAASFSRREQPLADAETISGPDSARVAEEPETEPESESAAVQELLAAADKALADNRLTRPPVTNAYGLYRHVLLLESDNRAAREGIKRIQQRYVELIEDALAQEQTDSAWQYWRRAEFVGMPEVRLQALAAKIERAGAEPSVSLANNVPSSKSQPSVTKPAKEDVAGQTGTAEATRGTIELSWRSREAASLARAGLLLQGGDRARAIGELEALIADYPQAESAALMLFDLYLQTGNTQNALALQAVAQTLPLRHYYQARLLARADQNNEALTILEQVSPSGAVKQPYLALQAGLYQRNAQYQRAADLYQQLVGMDSRQPTYWLGLGVAAEALGQRTKALQAFMAADQLAPADPAVDQYIERRIQVLSNP